MSLLVFFIGLCFGSFVTLASWRLPRGENVVHISSRCTSCGNTLAARDLLPVGSWLLARGKCRFCKAGVHWRYPAIELVTGAVFALIYWQYGLTLSALLLALFATALMVMIVADFEHYMIPDSIHWFLLPLGAFWHWQLGTPWQEPLSGLALGLVLALGLRYGYSILRKREMLGLGDVKFFAVAGLWLGVRPFVPFLFFAGFFGILTALVWRMMRRGEVFPFGPALAASLFLCVAFPAIPEAFWNLQRFLYR